MKNILLVSLFVLPLYALAQYPSNPNKQRLGYQTTALGLTYFSDTIPLHTPSNYMYDAELVIDTVNDVSWQWTGYSWRATGVVRQMLAPPATKIAGGNTLDFRYADWWRDVDSVAFTFSWDNTCWMPLQPYRGDTIPDDEAAAGSIGATCFTQQLWHDTSVDSLRAYTGGSWIAVGSGSGGGGSGTVNSVVAGTGMSVDATDPANPIVNNTAPDQVVVITSEGINATTGSYPSFTITGTEVDGSVTNEGGLTVGAGTGTTSTIISNTSGSTPVTLEAGTNITISEDTGTNTITLAASGGGVTSWIIVDGDGNGDYLTIQEGIDAAEALSLSADNTATVFINPGVYLENTVRIDSSFINLVGFAKGAVLQKSSSTGAVSALNISASATNVNVVNYSVELSVINIQTIGITISGEASLSNSTVVVANRAKQYISVNNSEALVTNCEFTGHTDTNSSFGGVELIAGTMSYCTFSSDGAIINQSGGNLINNSVSGSGRATFTGGYVKGVTVSAIGTSIQGGTFENCIFTGSINQSSPIASVTVGSATFTDCSFINTYVGSGVGAAALKVGSSGYARLYNCGIIARDESHYALANTSGVAATVELHNTNIDGRVDFTDITVSRPSVFSFSEDDTDRKDYLYADGMTTDYLNTDYTITLDNSDASIYLFPHDATLTNVEGLLFADNSENRLKYYDGTTLQQLAFVSDLSGGGTMSSFDLAADSGTTATIEDAETVTHTGGSGIVTSIAANTVTHALALGEVAVNASVQSDTYLTGYDASDAQNWNYSAPVLRTYFQTGISDLSGDPVTITSTGQIEFSGTPVFVDESGGGDLMLTVDNSGILNFSTDNRALVSSLTANRPPMYTGTGNEMSSFPLESTGTTTKFTQTTSVQLPTGSTALQGSPADGSARYNSDTDKFQLRINGAWEEAATIEDVEAAVVKINFTQNADASFTPTKPIEHYTIESTSGASSDTNLSLPTASATYAGYILKVWSIDTSGSWDNTVSAATIQNGAAIGSSITLSNFQATEISCIQVTSAGSYRWVVTNQY